jgi:crotonobetainyl-CoA:carnitine CoA-transferase CaiB-like acyl-CoA transferase
MDAAVSGPEMEGTAANPQPLPLSGLRVLDFGHTVMGPCCGLVLADMGAEIIKVEAAPDGDRTRHLKGFGMGYFGFLNRNKRSLAVDAKTPAGRAVLRRLVSSADVLIENFGPGVMQRLGLDYDRLRHVNPRLIYCELKGFMDGPYQNRPALDEVVQMMAGLAYMTGPPGMPLRAGTSVVDIVGGLFGVIGVMAALQERAITGQGKHVKSALFESTVFLMGQHLSYASQSADPIPPMPARISAWAVYDVFDLREERKIFVGITSDRHWHSFCAEFGLDELAADPALVTNNQRIAARERLMPALREIFATLTLAQASERLARANLPFSPLNRPEDLFVDRHLVETGGILQSRLPDGTELRTPRLPLRYGSERFDLRTDPPDMGAHTDAILAELGFDDGQIAELRCEKIVA